MEIKALAHRGYSSKYPENTFSAFKAAIDLGFERIETDVHLSKDGIPVVMHDMTVNRMTDGKGAVKDCTVNELKQLKINENEIVPTLEETLLFLKDYVIVHVEMKQKGNLYPGLEEKVLKVIRRCGMESEVIISSFDHYSLARIRKMSMYIQLHLILGGATPSIFPYMKEINAKIVSTNNAFITDEFVKDCEAHNVSLVAGGVNTIEQMKKMFLYPIVLCATDELELFKSTYEQFTKF